MRVGYKTVFLPRRHFVEVQFSKQSSGRWLCSWSIFDEFHVHVCSLNTHYHGNFDRRFGEEATVWVDRTFLIIAIYSTWKFSTAKPIDKSP